MLSGIAMRRWLVLMGVGGGLALACGSSEPPLPAYRTQPSSALEEVPYPPPPARVEVVPPSPRDRAVWIDGEWTWQTRRWAWKPGRWVIAPEGSRFSPWTYVRDRLGTLYFAAGAWRDSAGNALPDPAPLVTSEGAVAPVVTPDGDLVPASPTVPLADGGMGGGGMADASSAPIDASPSRNAAEDAAAP